jgi:6,7-dimethyl-8-ribityllumazine synthase
MSGTGGFWPGETPAAEDEQAQQSMPEVVEQRGWPGTEEPVAEPVKPEPVTPEPVTPEPVEQATEPPAAAVAPMTTAAEPEPEVEEEEPEPAPPVASHVPGELDIPDGVAVLEGSPSGADRTVGVVVSRFNGEITDRLLASTLEALAAAGVADERITVMPVPGAFELPIGAMALAKTRRYSCVIALGCVVRGETAHFDYIAGEAASGLQLAGLETGVPVAFGVLTVDTAEQAEARIDKGADVARAALEMADLFSQVRKQAKA